MSGDTSGAPDQSRDARPRAPVTVEDVGGSLGEALRGVLPGADHGTLAIERHGFAEGRGDIAAPSCQERLEGPRRPGASERIGRAGVVDIGRPDQS